MSPLKPGPEQSRGRTDSQNSDGTASDARPEAGRLDFGRDTRRFFETSLDLLAVSTTDGEFVDVNPRFEEVLGWSHDQLTSRPFIEFVHPDDREATLACLEKHETGDGTVRGFVNRYECEDGDYVWLEWQSRIYEEDGLIYASARNITDLRRARRQKRRLQEQALRAHQLESISELAGGIAHKFNNRLTTIVGNAGLLSQKTDDDELASRLDAILNAANEANELTQQLLAYAGEEQVERQPNDLSEVVKSTDKLIHSIVAEDVSVAFDLKPSLPTVSLDPARIRQVLMNLVTNANDAMPDGGKISVRTTTRAYDPADLQADPHQSELGAGEFVVLEISDTGEGMEPDIQDRMFEPFFTTKFVGRGVGLAATLGIVRAHDGSILVDSETGSGSGSTVSVLLPAADASSPFDVNPGLDRVPDGTVLVADDYSAVSLIRRTLSRPGIEVRGAKSDTALFSEVERDEEWLAVVIDPMHPRFREMRVVERLTEFFGSDVPIIASTVRQSSEGPSHADIQVADAVLEKPYTAKQLVSVLSRVT
jgi:PAS domain S-box-containing protein